MVHWLWVVVALFGGALAGIMSSALCVMAGSEPIEDAIDRESNQGCGSCKAGCTD